MLNSKFILIVLINLIFLVRNSVTQDITYDKLKLFGKNKNTNSLTDTANKNKGANISLGFGKMFYFRKEPDLNLLLSADFTLFLKPSLFLKVNYDHIFKDKNRNLISVSPGICFSLNNASSVHLSLGLGISNEIIPFFAVTTFEYQYKLSKRFLAGVEVKYLIGGVVLPVNLNFIINLN